MYRPKPLDTAAVRLPAELEALIERIAEHNHDVWAQGRLAEGWSLGAERSDALRTHPGLVAYAELPESEKDYDRRTAREVLCAVVAMGFEIGGAGRGPAPTEEALARAREMAEQQLRRGDPLLAHDLATEALATWPGDLRLRQLQGLALARSGAVERANGLLKKLFEEEHDGESGGLLARTHKDLAEHAPSDAERKRHLEEAFRLYEESFRESVRRGVAQDIWFTGINAATLARWRGKGDESRALAREVSASGEQNPADGAAEYWRLATLGEAALLLGDRPGAEARYREAAALAEDRPADLSTTRKQARRLLASLDESSDWLDEVMKVPPVVVFTGHMIDGPRRAEPRFPAACAEAVKGVLAERLASLGPVSGYASAACGADLLFHEAMHEAGRESHVVLPFPREAFRTASVDCVAGDWGSRFDRVLERAATVSFASDHHATGSPSTFDYANLLLTGAARLRAQALETDLVPLAVWDGKGGDGPGGTAWTVDCWRDLGLEVERIDPLSLGATEKAGSAPSSRPPEPAAPSTEADHPLMAMLFADAVGYSKLSEDQIPIFVERFLGAVAQLIARTKFPPILKETAGDGFYFVFESVRDAGRFSLELRDLIAGIDWPGEGLPATMALRTALHCGPVHRCFDPVSGLEKYTGPHTSRAARIEPITPPGQVYASQAFAAVAAATGVRDVAFEYVGQTSLAKKYGSFALFHVRPAPH